MIFNVVNFRKVLNFLLVVLCLATFELSAQKLPKWVYKTPTSKSGKFYYFTGSGLTKEAAIASAYQTMASTFGVNVYEGKVVQRTDIKDDKRSDGFEKTQTLEVLKKRYDVRPVDMYFDGETYYILIGTKI